MPEEGPDPALASLNALVGEWSIEGSHPLFPSTTVRGTTTFAWLDGGFFLVQRWSVELPEFPDGIAIIGKDTATDSLSEHYYDSRGVARVYEMSLSDGLWTLSRDGPPFSQRFRGRFSDDGTTITGSWEKSSDGSTWEHDFDLIYTRIS
jgi:hypothetical protein